VSSHVCLMLDTSGSMDLESLRHALVAMVNDEAEKALLPAGLFTFSDKLRSRGRVADVQSLSEILSKVSPRGRTALWESLGELLDKIPEGVEALVLCVTDGGDRRSCDTQDVVRKRYADRAPLVSLKIMLVGEHRVQASGDDGIDEVAVPRMEDVPSELVYALALSGRLRLDMSLSILPLTDRAEANDVERVRRAAVRTVRYLEDLTDLRYYPVPTYIVDKHTLEAARAGEGGVADLDGHEKGDFRRIAEFIKTVSLIFHRSPYSTGEGAIPAAKLEICRGTLDAAQMDALLVFAEHCFGSSVADMLDEHRANSDLYIEEPLRSWLPPQPTDQPLMQSLRLTREIQRVMACVIERHPDSIGEGPGLWFSSGGQGIKPTPTNLAPWERRLIEGELAILGECVTDGEWATPDAPVKLMRVSLDCLERHLSRIVAAGVPDYIRDVRTYGMYFAPPGDSAGLDGRLRELGFPEWFGAARGGLVLICMEELRRRLQAMAEKRSSQDAGDILDDVLTDILIHEHAHAVIREGQGGDLDPMYRAVQSRREEDYGWEEALAEWTEINYFRNHTHMFEDVRNHAASGTYPAWPYAGALVIEEKCRAGENPTETFRSLLRQHRATAAGGTSGWRGEDDGHVL
jgi:hypothetical protein